MKFDTFENLKTNKYSLLQPYNLYQYDYFYLTKCINTQLF